MCKVSRSSNGVANGNEQNWQQTYVCLQSPYPPSTLSLLPILFISVCDSIGTSTYFTHLAGMQVSAVQLYINFVAVGFPWVQPSVSSSFVN